MVAEPQTETETAARTAAASGPLSPVKAKDRLDSLDLLRGLAIMGILAVNAVAFSMPWPVYGNPSLAPFPMEGNTALGWWIMHVFFEQKFVSLFSMLFGVSIFLVGGERSDLERGALLRRRLFILAIIGVIHGTLIWYGDILLMYALLGFVVLLVRSWRPRNLFILGVVIYGLWGLLLFGSLAVLGMAPPETQAEIAAQMAASGNNAEAVAETIAAYATLEGSLRSNFSTWTMGATAGFLTYGPLSAGLMMIGMAMFKWGVFKGRAPVWLYGLLAVLGAGGLYLIAQESTRHLAEGFPQPMASAPFANGMLAPVVTLGYVGVLMILLKGGLGGLLWPLRAMGRMAFTNYLTQSIIMTTIFNGGRGLGYYGEIYWPDLWAIVAGVWLVQLIWSPLWLSRFEMGPLEWVWRSLTYGRAVPITRRA